MTDYLTDEDIDKFFANDKNIETYIECPNCHKEFSLNAPGTKNRNHCPFCLFSVHVDDEVGDRKSNCNGLMEPIGKFYRPNKEEVIIHKCLKCAKISNNRIAGDDNEELLANLKILPKQ